MRRLGMVVVLGLAIILITDVIFTYCRAVGATPEAAPGRPEVTWTLRQVSSGYATRLNVTSGPAAYVKIEGGCIVLTEYNDDLTCVVHAAACGEVSMLRER